MSKYIIFLLSSCSFYDEPTLITGLAGKQVVQIACGSTHSAAVTSEGELYTWGRGNYGRLGHGSSEDHLAPMLVNGLRGYHVIDVACGSGDAHSLAVADDGRCTSNSRSHCKTFVYF